MKETKEFSELLTNIQKGLEVYTVSELSEAIVEVLAKRDERTVKSDRVIEAICTLFNCKKRTLLNSSFRGDNRLPASILIVFLNKEYGITHRYISSSVFAQPKYSYSNIHRIIKLHENLNPKVKSDADFILYYDKVKNLVNGF